MEKEWKSAKNSPSQETSKKEKEKGKGRSSTRVKITSMMETGKMTEDTGTEKNGGSRGLLRPMRCSTKGTSR